MPRSNHTAPSVDAAGRGFGSSGCAHKRVHALLRGDAARASRIDDQAERSSQWEGQRPTGTSRTEIVGDHPLLRIARQGKREAQSDALAIIKELEGKYARKEAAGASIAAVYAGLGDKDKAFEWLEKDFQNRDGYLPDLTVSITHESLRGDPRYKDLLKRMGLPG